MQWNTDSPHAQSADRRSRLHRISILGCVLLLLISMAVGYVLMASYQRNHPGLGAVTGGISETAVIATHSLRHHRHTLITLRPNRT
ncbi:MAG TPA: hypothetical protein VK578_10010 [Edaphobacter sp.]|nr:hypothetical protein [Edaphobacter sp.]